MLNLTKNDWIWPKVSWIPHFWSYSTRHVCRCGNIYFKIRSSSSSQFLWLSVFGHVKIFRSYSFGHLVSVMLTTLQKIDKINNKKFLLLNNFENHICLIWLNEIDKIFIWFLKSLKNLMLWMFYKSCKAVLWIVYFQILKKVRYARHLKYKNVWSVV